MANFNFNEVILGGRLTHDPELKKAGETNVVNFSLAVSRVKKDETDFINCTAFGKTAEFITQFFRKGSCVCVVGSIRVDNYEKDGEKKTATKVIVREAHFVDAKSEAPQPTETPDAAPQSPVPAPAAETNSEDDEDLPF